MITLEQVDKLKERANVSYEDAKAALEITGGDLLEAVIYLEKLGKISGPYMQAYNTQTGSVHGGPAPQQKGGKGKRKHGCPDPGQYGKYGQYTYEDYLRKRRTCRTKCGVLWKKFCALVRKANTNQFVAYRGGHVLISMPVTLLIIAAMFFFWVTIPLLIIGLFCDCRYQFKGPNFGRQSINSIMDQAADTADTIKRSVLADEEGMDEDIDEDIDEDMDEVFEEDDAGED